MNQAEQVDTSITIVRKFSASTERVYEAWTSPEQICQWIGPAEVYCKEADIDLRVDGNYRILMIGESNEHTIIGKYKEVIPNEKLQFTWKWQNSDGPETLVTLVFNEIEDGTELTLLHENFATKEAAQSHHYGHSGGLDKLEKLFSN